MTSDPIRIELVPTLSHCVESAAKEEYESSVGKYLWAHGHDQNLQEKLELVLAFLQSVDFHQLRRESEKHLVEGKDVRFVLYMEEGEPKYEMQVG